MAAKIRKDPIQAEILLLLAADDPEQTDWLNVSPIPGKLFLVGDPNNPSIDSGALMWRFTSK